MAETKQFKAESKRLLDMMINSIYTHKEIFLRELISNASDAIDKLYFKSLTDDSIGMNKNDFAITIAVDKDSNTLTISDNGIGMTEDELENNLGIIANSGSFKFKNENEKTEDVDIIGQFGVGFYSAFMVAKQVEVRTKAYGSDKAYVWNSTGVDGYTIEECEKEKTGTEITLTLKEDTENESYSEYLDSYKIKELVKKYSDYIRCPIRMDIEKSRRKADAADDDYSDAAYEKYIENETLNSMVPLWRKNKNELKAEDYNNFYKEKFYDFNDPLKYIHSKVEGTTTYDSLLFIPSQAPYNFYSKDFEKGLQLYSSGVLITDKCADLLPDYFSFVRGLVDSADLSLNISREMLQHDHQLKLIAKSIEKTIKNELKKLLNNNREEYEKLWKAFGIQIKFGVYDNYGRDREAVQDLLMFVSSAEKKLTTLDEYVSRMKEDQKYIYYAAGDSVSKIEALPQTELLRDKGYE
ncbi:MAG: molecular chaperone HtpG, partial [Oscillospiraceae bacterium]|nr:molecular chaperone HtpG [Oscillospiraceae bacterium]